MYWESFFTTTLSDECFQHFPPRDDGSVLLCARVRGDERVRLSLRPHREPRTAAALSHFCSHHFQILFICWRRKFPRTRSSIPFVRFANNSWRAWMKWKEWQQQETENNLHVKKMQTSLSVVFLWDNLDLRVLHIYRRTPRRLCALYRANYPPP